MIVDLQNSENEEDDQFVVEAAPPLSEVSELEMVSAMAGRFVMALSLQRSVLCRQNFPLIFQLVFYPNFAIPLLRSLKVGF